MGQTSHCDDQDQFHQFIECMGKTFVVSLRISKDHCFDWDCATSLGLLSLFDNLGEYETITTLGLLCGTMEHWRMDLSQCYAFRVRNQSQLRSISDACVTYYQWWRGSEDRRTPWRVGDLVQNVLTISRANATSNDSTHEWKDTWRDCNTLPTTADGTGKDYYILSQYILQSLVREESFWYYLYQVLHKPVWNPHGPSCRACVSSGTGCCLYKGTFVQSHVMTEAPIGKSTFNR